MDTMRTPFNTHLKEEVMAEKKTAAKKTTAKKTTAKKTTAKKTTTRKRTTTRKKKVDLGHDVIAIAAYLKAEADGFAGDPAIYWLSAEEELKKSA